MATSLEPNQNSKSPVTIQEIQEIALTIAAKNLNPMMLTEEFLKFSGIIPTDWALARQPVLNQNMAQIAFQNGVSIVAQPRTVTFMETLSAPGTEVRVPAIARQYVSKLTNAEYQALSISPKSIIPFPGDQDGARRYIASTLLAPGPWQDFGKAPMQAGLNLLYQLERCQFSLSINEATIQAPEQAPIPALLFAGNFNYTIATENLQERLAQLEKGIDDWQSDLTAFQEIVKQRFLGQQETVFSMKAM